MKFDFIEKETINIIIFTLIMIIFALIPAYFYIKNYDKNMQKHKEEQARRKAQGLSKYMKFIISVTTILTIFTIFVVYRFDDGMSIVFLLALAFVYVYLYIDLSYAIHTLFIVNIWILFVWDFFDKFIKKVF